MTPIKHSGLVFGESNISKVRGKKFKTGTCVSCGRCTRGIQTPWSCRLHAHVHVLPFTHTWAEKEGRKANFSAHSTFVPNLPDVLFPYLPTAQEIYLLLDPVSLKSSTNSLRPSPTTTTQLPDLCPPPHMPRFLAKELFLDNLSNVGYF